MNFTRDPIIETVITPKEGFKLLVRPSGVETGDEYQVDAIEIVSFGKSMFFRSLEKPKAFLLPVSDYEVIEVKETRVVLKKASIEKPIKIAGGKQPSQSEEENIVSAEQKKEPVEKEEEPKKGRKRKKSRLKKAANEKKEETSSENNQSEHAPPPRKMRVLIPPPSALISDSISKYKHAFTTAREMIPEGVEGSTTGDVINEEKHEPELPPVEENPQDTTPSTHEEERLEEYHPQDDETIDQSLLPELDINEEDPLLKNHYHEEE